MNGKSCGGDDHPEEVRVSAAGRTDVGLKREQNEDSIEVCERLGLFAVADGMGGHAAGEVASQAAIETLREFIAQAAVDRDYTWPFGVSENLSVSENILYTAFHLANRRVCRLASENEDYAGMGTTLSVIYVHAGKVHLGHVGDSRIYRLRDDRLECLTRDHTWVNEQIQRNVLTETEARNHRWRNVITRALGNRVEIEVDLRTLDPAVGDIFVLCSDGLNEMVADPTIHQILSDRGTDLRSACDALITLSNGGGGLDNVSVVLLRVDA